MADLLGELEIRIRGKLDDLDRDFGDARTKAVKSVDDIAGHTNKRVSGIFSSVGKIGGVLAGVGAVVGAGKFLGGALSEMELSVKVSAATAAGIKSTGGAANITAKQVDHLATSLSNATGMDDELIQSGANMLLTFTNVRNEVGKGNAIFDRATGAALDLSSRGFGSVESASVMLGKALNDPVAGLTALGKAGVQFSADQKNAIRTMVATGDILGAQKMILKEIEAQVGGSAKAQATAADKARVAWGNLQETVGKGVAPAFAFASNAAVKAIGAITSGIDTLGPKIAAGFGAMKAAFSGEGVTSDGYVGVMERIGVAVRAAVDWVVANWPRVKAAVIDVAQEIVDWVQANWPKIRDTIKETGETIVKLVAGVVDVVRTIWENFGTQIMAAAQVAWKFISTYIGAMLDQIQGIIKIVTGLIQGDWSRVWEGIKQVLGGAWDAMRAIVEAALGLIRQVISAGWELVKGIFTGAWDALIGIVREGTAFIVDKILGAFEWIVRGAASAFGWVPIVGGKLKEAARAFEEFRDDVNRALRGIEDREVNVSVRVAEIRAADPGVSAGTAYHEATLDHYALGGWVDGPVGVPRLAIVHGGEYVLTPEQAAMMGRGYSSPTDRMGRWGHDGAAAGVNLNVYIDGDLKGVVREVRAELDRTGRHNGDVGLRVGR